MKNLKSLARVLSFTVLSFLSVAGTAPLSHAETNAPDTQDKAGQPVSVEEVSANAEWCEYVYQWVCTPMGCAYQYVYVCQ